MWRIQMVIESRIRTDILGESYSSLGGIIRKNVHRPTSKQSLHQTLQKIGTSVLNSQSSCTTPQTPQNINSWPHIIVSMPAKQIGDLRSSSIYATPTSDQTITTRL